MPDLKMYTLLNFHPHYVTTIGKDLHLVGYQTKQGILDVNHGKRDNVE